MVYDWKKIGERIKIERKAIKLSMEELADRIGTTRQTISKLESGKGVETTVNILLSLCAEFDCELGYLLGEFDCKTRIVADIKEQTGFSEKAIENIIILKERSNCESGQFEAKIALLIADLAEYANSNRGDSFKLLGRFAESYFNYRLYKPFALLESTTIGEATINERLSFALQKYLFDFVNSQIKEEK